MKKLALTVVVLIAACGGKKDKDPGGGTTASGSAPAAGSGSAPAAGSGSAPAAGSGSDMAAGSGSGSAKDGHGELIDDPGIKFDTLPAGWEAGHGKLDTFEPVNDSKWVGGDNASFVFEYGLDNKDLPADPKEYGAILEKSGYMEKITKQEKTPNGHYYESAHGFRYVITAGDKRIHCGGPLYNDAAHKDYDSIPKVREKVIAEAKKICQTAKL